MPCAQFYFSHALITTSVQVLAVFTGRGGSTAGFVDSADAEAGTVGLVLSDTSFYYESGGQVYDTGALQGEWLLLCLFPNAFVILVLDKSFAQIEQSHIACS